MTIDTGRILRAALVAALADATPSESGHRIEHPTTIEKPRLSGGRALLLGAGLATAARLAAGPRGRDLLGSIYERVVEADGGGLPAGD
ncbi:MAG: hypothetical protein ACRDMX_02055 [Solirubrobacteraceae bacterium]